MERRVIGLWPGGPSYVTLGNLYIKVLLEQCLAHSMYFVNAITMLHLSNLSSLIYKMGLIINPQRKKKETENRRKTKQTQKEKKEQKKKKNTKSSVRWVFTKIRNNV